MFNVYEGEEVLIKLEGWENWFSSRNSFLLDKIEEKAKILMNVVNVDLWPILPCQPVSGLPKTRKMSCLVIYQGLRFVQIDYW